MPIYDFICEPCKKTFDDLVPMDTEFALCPKCGKPSKKHILKAPRCIFLDKNGHSTTPIHIPDDIANATEEELDRDLGLA